MNLQFRKIYFDTNEKKKNNLVEKIDKGKFSMNTCFCLFGELTYLIFFVFTIIELLNMKDTGSSFIMITTMKTFFSAPSKISFTEKEFIADLNERLLYLYYNTSSTKAWINYKENIPISSLRLTIVMIFELV